MAALGFDVAAEYFYALGAPLPMAIDADQRYAMATHMRAEQLESRLEDAILGRIIPKPAGMTAAEAAAQIARRLVALGLDGAADSTLTVAQYPEIAGLLSDWLGYHGDDAGLWPFLLGSSAAHQATNHKAQVLLVLGALTGWDVGPPSLNGMFTALDNLHPLSSADVLAGLSAANWTNFFGQHPEYLPASTLPGSTLERIAAFLRFLTRFYSVASAPAAPGGPPTTGQPPLLDRAGFDPIAAFVFAGGFTFGTPLTNAAAIAQLVFPGDDQAQAWLVEAVTIVNTLWGLTTGVLASGSANAAALQFSLVEGLFARGFTSAESIGSLSLEEFTAALTGTVAFRSDWAAKIWANANGQPSQPVAPGGFRPVNPDGDLTSCIPLPELSPLGAIEYLCEMLRAGLGSTCATTADPDPASLFGALLRDRRGDLTALLADRANLSTPLPVIDLVNECLEHLAAQVAHGASPVGGGVVRDTEPAVLAGHVLRQPGSPAGTTDDGAHDPATLFAALPQYASPAVPVAEPDGYAALATDFSAPTLPYDQPVDMSRTYLRALGSSRYQTMRRFRSAITEFVLNPVDQPSAADPAGFDATRWRYPVRADIAREYLGFTAAEDQLLFETPIALSGAPGTGYLLLRALYGFPADAVTDDAGASRPWLDQVVILSEFLERTGLEYCDFLELWKCRFVAFGPADDSEAGFDDCPPCCPDRVRLAFPGLDPSTELARLAVFIRLWRRLRHVPGAAYSFAQLADICSVLGLLLPSGQVNPGFLRQLAAFQMLRDLLDLPLHSATGSARTQLLALWDRSQTSPQWSWALDRLLDHIEDHAEREHGCPRRTPEFLT